MLGLGLGLMRGRAVSPGSITGVHAQTIAVTSAAEGTVEADPDAAIAALFASGEKGGWYDPSDLSTLWQNSGGTGAVTADGNPLGQVSDKSGNSNHVVQGTSGNRPLYKTNGTLHWIEYDGTDDFLQRASSFDLSGATALTVGVALYKASDAEGVTVFDTGNAINPRMYLRAPDAAAASTYVTLGQNGSVRSVTGGSGAAPETAVIISEIRLSPSRVAMTKSGTLIGENTTSVGTTAAAFGASHNFVLGASSATGELSGRIYGAIVLGREATAGELTTIDAWLMSKAGL